MQRATITIPAQIISVIVVAGALGACASASGPPADPIVYRTDDAPAPALDASRTPGRPMPTRPEHMDDMTEGERMAWFEANGLYPYPWYPTPDGQSLGYVHTPTDYSWIGPAILTAGAIYGLYRLKRHYDWW